MIRLYVSIQLFQEADLTLSESESHYIMNVMRLKVGEEVHLFNARDGQWRCHITCIGKKNVRLLIREQVSKPTKRDRRVHAVLTPIKPKRLELAVEKLTELNVSDIHFIITQRTQVRHINEQRLMLIAKEAAEQCERLDLPIIHNTIPLNPWVEIQTQNPLAPILLMADERMAQKTIKETLLESPPQQDIAFIIGPEGGFAELERKKLTLLPNLVRVSLGPTILRAETAAIILAGALHLEAYR